MDLGATPLSPQNKHGPGLDSALTVSELSALQDLRSGMSGSANARQALALRLALLEQDPNEREQFEQRVAAIRLERQAKRNHYLGHSRAVRDTGDLAQRSRLTLSPSALLRVPDGAVAPSNALLTNRRLVQGDGQALRERHEAWVSKHEERLSQTKLNALALEEKRRMRAAQLVEDIEREEARVAEMQAQAEQAMTARERAIWEEHQHALQRERETLEAAHAAEMARLAAHEETKALRRAARVARLQAQEAEEARLDEIAYQMRKAQLVATGHLSTQGILHAAAQAALAAKRSSTKPVTGAPTYATPAHHTSASARRRVGVLPVLLSAAPPGDDFASDEELSSLVVAGSAEAEARVVQSLRREIEAGLADEQHAFLQASLQAAQAQMARADAARLAKQREAERERDQQERERDAAALAAASSSNEVAGRRLHSRQGSVSGAKLFASLALNSALLNRNKPRSHSRYD